MTMSAGVYHKWHCFPRGSPASRDDGGRNRRVARFEGTVARGKKERDLSSSIFQGKMPRRENRGDQQTDDTCLYENYLK